MAFLLRVIIVTISGCRVKHLLVRQRWSPRALFVRIFYSVQPSYYNGATSLSSMLPSGVSQTSNSPPPMDTPPEGRFMLEVLGRNGAFVDDVWVSMKGVVPLGRRCVSTQSVKLTQNEDPNRRACVLFCVAAPCHRR